MGFSQQRQSLADPWPCRTSACPCSGHAESPWSPPQPGRGHSTSAISGQTLVAVQNIGRCNGLFWFRHTESSGHEVLHFATERKSSFPSQKPAQLPHQGARRPVQLCSPSLASTFPPGLTSPHGASKGLGPPAETAAGRTPHGTPESAGNTVNAKTMTLRTLTPTQPCPVLRRRGLSTVRVRHQRRWAEEKGTCSFPMQRKAPAARGQAGEPGPAVPAGHGAVRRQWIRHHFKRLICSGLQLITLISP